MLYSIRIICYDEFVTINKSYGEINFRGVKVW